MRAQERRRHAADWGVDERQIARDAVISDVLHRWHQSPFADGVFIGGTALSRTVLSGYRLSEDIDIVVGDPARAAEATSEWVVAELSRTHRGLTAEAREGRATHQVTIRVGNDYPLKLEMIHPDNVYRQDPVELRDAELRYEGLPDHIGLPVPDNDSLAAMKLAAWGDRQTARDLADLYGLALVGGLGPEGVERARRHGTPIIRTDWASTQPPNKIDETAWSEGLAGQMSHPPPLDLVWLTVRSGLAQAAGWDTAAHWTEQAQNRLERYEFASLTDQPQQLPDIPASGRECGAQTINTGPPCSRWVAAHSRTCGLHWT